jgi:hypothetical protein
MQYLRINGRNKSWLQLHGSHVNYSISGVNSVSTLLFIIMSVTIAIITDDRVVFMCGGKGEVFQNSTKLGRKKAYT